MKESEEIITLMDDVETHLIKESKDLDPEFADVIDKEFWNLLL